MELKQNARCEKIARTGRVQDWLDSPESRLPVSCTTFVVEDTMEGPDGIEASWRFVSHALRNAAGAAINLSKLRAKGEDNGKGLIASGPVSFAGIYSKLNEVLRRGGKFRNGAITLHLDYDHPDAMEFIQASRVELPWVKRSLTVDDNLFNNAPDELIDALLKGIASGDMWLTKKRFDDSGERIWPNVCEEIWLKHRGTCLLQHV
ncbi:MAG: ribonucleotide reductase, partial [Verrucomicrobia bacterium]|nr:ribonucleotide reductase [Verrucomicrobiota bacterium]